MRPFKFDKPASFDGLDSGQGGQLSGQPFQYDSVSSSADGGAGGSAGGSAGDSMNGDDGGTNRDVHGGINQGGTEDGTSPMDEGGESLRAVVQPKPRTSTGKGKGKAAGRGKRKGKGGKGEKDGRIGKIAKSGNAPTAKTVWPCSKCTFVNPIECHPICSICESRSSLPR